jgi:hypothetical protein
MHQPIQPKSLWAIHLYSNTPYANPRQVGHCMHPPYNRHHSSSLVGTTTAWTDKVYLILLGHALFYQYIILYMCYFTTEFCLYLKFFASISCGATSFWLYIAFWIRFKEKSYGSSGATSGLTSSLAFTPVQVESYFLSCVWVCLTSICSILVTCWLAPMFIFLFRMDLTTWMVPSRSGYVILYLALMFIARHTLGSYAFN